MVVQVISTFTFTHDNGGTGAAATPTVKVGVPTTFSLSFVKTYAYTGNVPDIVANDLASIHETFFLGIGRTGRRSNRFIAPPALGVCPSDAPRPIAPSQLPLQGLHRQEF